MSNQHEDDLFDGADFNSIKTEVSVHNHTSKTSPQSKSKLNNDADAQPNIKLMEIHDNGISLDTPERSAAVGHILECLIDVTGTSLPLQVRLKGKVSEVVPLENSRCRLDVEIIEVDPRFFAALKNVFKSRQQEINDFFDRLRA